MVAVDVSTNVDNTIWISLAIDMIIPFHVGFYY